MPLHLLGKKSWNVYNTENIERVRRDEAEARSHEAQSERHTRDNEAEDRLARLRAVKQDADNVNPERPRSHDVSRKRRGLDGEDDTDKDLRFARQRSIDDAPGETNSSLVDRHGHIDLIKAAPEQARRAQKAPGEGAAQVAMGMKLADAAGFQPGSAKPWYSSTSADGGYAHGSVSKDAWGNEDARRVQRDQQRIAVNDPLASMKKGVKQLRDAEGRRQAWMDQRESDLNEVVELARRARKHRRRKERSESLDGFDLDKGYRDDRRNRGSGERQHHHRRRRGRSRSPRRDLH